MPPLSEVKRIVSEGAIKLEQRGGEKEEGALTKSNRCIYVNRANIFEEKLSCEQEMIQKSFHFVFLRGRRKNERTRESDKTCDAFGGNTNAAGDKQK